MIEEYEHLESMKEAFENLVIPRDKQPPRDQISEILKKHYGFKLPNHATIYIPSCDEENNLYGKMYMYLASGKFGAKSIREIVNCSYFRTMHLHQDEYGENYTFLVFGIKAAFKREYNALRGQCEFY